MRIALCAPFMEADILSERIRAVGSNAQRIDTFNSVSALLAAPGLSAYSALWIAAPGAAGMEAVIQAREHSPALPIVWVSDDEKFGLIGYRLKVSMFLTNDSTAEEYMAAVQRCRAGWCYG